MSELVTPIAMAGYGRSGTTAVMALLGTSPRVAFDRLYPYENRYLTYLTKFALLAGCPGSSLHYGALQLYEYADDHFGPMPWPALPAEDGTPTLNSPPDEWLSELWRTFSETIRRRQPAATHYAEKVPVWLPAEIRDAIPSRVLHLVRDPRDVFLSARAFVQKRGAVGFGVDADSSDLEQARHTAHGLLTFAENERADRGRADSLLVRYEDWIERPAEFIERLNSFLGVDLTSGDDVTRHLGLHQTSADPASSIGRWRREPLPAAVQACLEAHLARSMADYGYEHSAAALPVEVIPNSQMSCSADAELTPSANGATVTIHAGDFWVELPPGEFPAAQVAEFWACLRGGAGNHCSLYWRGPGAGFSEEQCIHLPFRPGPHWQILRFQLGKHQRWCGPIEQFRVDLFNGAVTPGQQGEVRWLRYVN